MIGVIADDLTGAAELGAVGWRLGLKAEILSNNRLDTTANLACVDTDSRSCTPDEAAKRAAAAATFLQAAGARWIYKKVDSVLRGNVTAEVEAVMRQLRYNRALLLPANPSLGRIIRDGQYFVGGTPIDRTEFAHDPEYPRRDAQVLRMVTEPQHFSLRLATNGNFVAPENTILIGQTDSAEAVRAWARARQDTVLPVGGAEFFSALLAGELQQPTPAAEEKFEFGDERQLFVCGSGSNAADQLFRSARNAMVPVFTLSEEFMFAKELSPDAHEALAQRVIEGFAKSKRVVIGIGLPQVSEARTAQRLSEHLVNVAALVIRRADIRYVFAEGGATSAELVRRMKWLRLEVCREWAPGVATLAVASESPVWLTIKPGSYSWPKAWTGAA
jgi:D-threonate/D-erythronate kinase